MHPLKPKFVCWQCGETYETDLKFCGACGTDMHRASALEHEAQLAGRPRRRSFSPDGPPYSTESDDLSRRSSDYDPWIGKVIDNRYRILEMLGAGGMGVVYKVEHQRMGKIAALKMLHADLASNREVQERFHREAEAVSRLNHHNTVQVFDFGADRGVLYLVMELVRGVDIGELVDRDGPLSFLNAAPLFAQTCASLIEAHEQGVIHRDLKPENIVITRTHRGRDLIKVLDFGLAKLSEREESLSSSSAGSVVGTPYYMSPEQIRGEDIDARSDIYSLGALMYKVLTGEPPFDANSPVGVLTKHLTDEPLPPSHHARDLDPRVDELVLRCLEKKAADRYQSAGALAEAIEDLHATLEPGQHTAPRLYPSSGRARSQASEAADSAVAISSTDLAENRLRRSDVDLFERRLRRRRTVRMIAIPLILAGGLAGGAYAWHWQSQKPRDVESEPNNAIVDATRIAANTSVRGRIGKRIDEQHGDRDLFSFAEPLPTDGSMTLSAHLEAQRNIDMQLELADSAGTPLVTINGFGEGRDEHLRRYRITTPVVIIVREVDGDALPSESISEHYRLSVDIAPVDPRLETEPNDLGGDANPIRVGQAVTAHFDTEQDVDTYRFEGQGGRYRVVTSGAQRAQLRVDGTPAGEVVELENGSLIEATPAGGVQGDAPYTVDVAPAS